jgi:hypothetical protein
VAGAGEGVGGAIVGLGVAGVSVGDGDRVGAIVGDGSPADAIGDSSVVGDGRPGVGESAGLGLAAGAAQAATSMMIRSATTG